MIGISADQRKAYEARAKRIDNRIRELEGIIQCDVCEMRQVAYLSFSNPEKCSPDYIEIAANRKKVRAILGEPEPKRADKVLWQAWDVKRLKIADRYLNRAIEKLKAKGVNVIGRSNSRGLIYSVIVERID